MVTHNARGPRHALPKASPLLLLSLPVPSPSRRSLKSFTARLFSMGAAIAPTTLVVGHLLSSLALSWFHAGLSMASPASPKLKHPV